VRAGSSLPIIMLTARDEEADRVAGLELGADDYVPKPFSPRELAARVKAVLRRSTAAPAADELVLADVLVSKARRDVSVAGAPVALSATEFNLLAFLMENPGIVFSREVLLDRVWGIEFPGGTRTVDQHVAQVRAKLGRPGLIETVRGAGYRATRV
jgi:DNA-binding response OmpR family regulator